MPDIYNTEESVDSLREINRLNESIIRRSRTTVQIYDNFSSSLSNVTSRFGRLQNIINNLNRGSSQIFNTSSMRNSSIQIETVEESYRNMSNTIAEVSQSQDDLNRSMDDTKKLSIDWKSLAGSASVIANFADGVSNAKAKIQQMSGGLENMKSLQSSIMQSAQRTGTSYTDMVNSVSQLSSMKNVFGSNNEALAFTELMSKGMSANGVTGESQSAAMDQIIQSMSSGNIGADTTQLLAQTSPIMTQGLQEYMNNIRGVEGSLQEMAGQGLITANDMRNAMFMSAGDIEQGFSSAPMTFGQVWTRIMNVASMACQPLLDALNFLISNFSIIGPIIFGVIAALGFLIVLTKTITIATQLWSSMQTLLNLAISVCPITYIILGIIAIIAIIYAVVGAINKFTGSTLSAAGIIFGALAFVGAFLYNTFIGIVNALIQFLWTRFVEPFISIIEFVLNVCNGGFDSFGGAVANLIGQIISWFLSLGTVVTKIIDAIFGTNWTSGLEEMKSEVLSWGKNDNAITLERNIKGFEGVDYGNAIGAGNDFGNGIDKKLSNLFGGGMPGIPDFGFNMPDSFYEDTNATANNTSAMKDTMEITDEDLKYLRDIAEQEAINRYTTSEIKVDFQNYAQINSNMDIGNVMETFATMLRETVDTQAEEVAVVV